MMWALVLLMSVCASIDLSIAATAAVHNSTELPFSASGEETPMPDNEAADEIGKHTLRQFKYAKHTRVFASQQPVQIYIALQSSTFQKLYAWRFSDGHLAYIHRYFLF